MVVHVLGYALTYISNFFKIYFLQALKSKKYIYLPTFFPTKDNLFSSRKVMPKQNNFIVLNTKQVIIRLIYPDWKT